MLCTQCAAASYSAAAKTLVERGQPCPRGPPDPVRVGQHGDEREPAVPAGRRFQSES